MTKDPDVRYTQEQLCIARYTLAVDRRYKKGETDFISCVAFGVQGEFAEKFLKKGTKIAVTGRLQTGSYEKDGVKHYTTDVVVEEQEFAESKNASKEDVPPTAPEPSAEGFMNIANGIDDLPFKK